MKYVLSIAIVVFIISVISWWGQKDKLETQFSFSNIGIEDDLTELPKIAIDTVKPTEIVELKDGDIFNLTASVVRQEVGNRVVKRLAYNGQIPGPIIKVQKGSKVTINFKNNIDMETSVHSHGLRGDWQMDGAVPIVPAVKVGETFSYELEFPDTGVFWYHPHVREDYQQELGLYGNFIVEEENYWNKADKEEYLIFDDILTDGKFSSERVTNTLMGRYGDTFLINDNKNYNLSLKQGEINRLFITNVANTRTFDLSFPKSQMKLVGGDLGRIEKEVMVDGVIIAPAERYVVELYYSEAGVYDITHRGKKIGIVTVKDGELDRKSEFIQLRDNDDYADLRNKFSTFLNSEPDKRLRLDIVMKGMVGNMAVMHGQNNNDDIINLMGVEMTREGAIEHCRMMPQMAGCEPYLDNNTEKYNDGIEWEDDMAMMNSISTDETLEWVIEDEITRKRNSDIDWSFKQGDLVKVRVYNDENGMHPMQHPLHFHGQRFVVLSRNGVSNDNLQWKDTVLIPRGETVDLLIDMSNLGKWMAHCHIAEHLHSGMMFGFSVE